MKFSIVVPVYNVEKYLEKCLKSIQNQTYDNFEVIIVNDGSTDNSKEIIRSFVKDPRFKSFNKKNGGLSDARNFGVKYTTGDFLLFIDSDDYIDKNLLTKLNNVIEQYNPDIIKFNFIDVIEDKEYKHFEKITVSKEVKLTELINFDYFEPACSYCYKINFYKENNFQFEIGKYHEDYGLIPLILLKSKSIYYLNYFGYFYVKRENSIINNNNKREKRAEDTLYFSLKNIRIIKKEKGIDNDTKDLLLNFYANGAINKLKSVENKKKYRRKLKDNKLYKYLIDKNCKQIIKKIICKISYDLYINFF